jgi:hypothetical protein
MGVDVRAAQDVAEERRAALASSAYTSVRTAVIMAAG